MQHSIRRAAHSDIQCHGIHKGRASSYVTRQHALVTIFVVSKGILDDLTSSLLEKFDTVGMGSKDGAVARQRETNSLSQRIHAISSKHAGTASTARTSTLLYLLHLLIRNGGVSTLDHRRNQVSILTTPATGFHRATRTEHGRNVQSHRSHQHTWRNLVAVGDANHSVSLMGIDHKFYAIGNDVARRQRIEHAIMTHSYTIVDGNGIELCGIAAHLLYLFAYYLTNLMQMGMTWHELRK